MMKKTLLKNFEYAKLLALLSLLFGLVSVVGKFVECLSVGILDIISAIFVILPIMMLFFYLFRLSNTIDVTVAMPIVLALQLVSDIVIGGIYFYQLIKENAYSISISDTQIFRLSIAVVMILCVAVPLIRLKKDKNNANSKALSVVMLFCYLMVGVVITGILPLFSNVYSLIFPEFVSNRSSMILNCFFSILEAVAYCAFFGSIILFGFRSQYVYMLHLYPFEEITKRMKSETVLKLLKDEFELELITEEEYQTKREEILEKL